MVMLQALLQLSGCGGGSSPSDPASNSTPFQLSGLGVQVSPMSAVLDIDGAGAYPLQVNSDDTVSTTVSDVSAGQHSLTVTYKSNALMLARASTTAVIQPGAATVVDFTPAEIDRNFDDDYDGWVNLAELQWGSDPLVASSLPPGESPRYVQSSAGGVAQSALYHMSDTVGEGIEAGIGSSAGYALSGGYTAYP